MNSAIQAPFKCLEDSFNTALHMMKILNKSWRVWTCDTLNWQSFLESYLSRQIKLIDYCVLLTKENCNPNIYSHGFNLMHKFIYQNIILKTLFAKHDGSTCISIRPVDTVKNV